VHARARCRRPPAGSRQSEQNHGYENEWEEALNDQENECTQDHPPRERRAGGREEDQRQEKGPGAQEGGGEEACRAKDRGPQGACEARSGEEASSQTRRAEEKSRSEEAGSGSAETDGPGAKAGRASSASTGAATRGAACHGNAHGAEARRPHGRWGNAAASRRRHGHARVILGRRHAKLEPKPERAALSAVLGARRRRHVVGKGRAATRRPSLSS